MVKKKQVFDNRKMSELTENCDRLASSYWKLEASSRERGYELWLKEVKKVKHFVDIYVSK